MSSKINLLPWREWERERLQRDFFINVAVMFVAAALLVYMYGVYVDNQADDQARRNVYLKEQIAEKDKRISEIRDLRTKREQLLARMQAIQELQGNRPIPVRVFDELVRTLANGVYYTKLEMAGNTITVTGTAESNNRISSLMRNLDASEWFSDPNLKGIKENRNFGPQASNFELTFVRTDPKGGESDEGITSMASFQEALEQLQNFDFNDLDFNNIGIWPAPLKWLLIVVVFAATVGVGYFYWLSGKLATLDSAEREEVQLRQQYEQKSFASANLGSLRRQREEMEATFGALLRQLPSDTEVPGLLEDITLTALDNGLKIQSVDLEIERTAEVYVELPITVTVEGGYHQFGQFVSGVSSLPRIVTLHDFRIAPKSSPSDLTMTILAKTYRYLEEDGG